MKSLIGGSSGAWRAGKLDDIFDLSEDDLDVAGSGAHEIRWLGVAGAMTTHPPKTLAYAPVYPFGSPGGCRGVVGRPKRGPTAVASAPRRRRSPARESAIGLPLAGSSDRRVVAAAHSGRWEPALGRITYAASAGQRP